MKKEIPALMSTMMVKAIMKGIKTMTRRTSGLKEVNKEPDKVEFIRFQEYPDGTVRAIFHHVDSDEDGSVKCPYGKVGDVIWIREAWSEPQLYDGFEPDYVYRADGEYQRHGNVKWRPSIHMPKKAARIWLEVTDIKVERLHDITEEDAVSEGIEGLPSLTTFKKPVVVYKDYKTEHTFYDSAVNSFESLWTIINGEESWNVNPWIWVVSFKVLSTTGKPKEQHSQSAVVRKFERMIGGKTSL